MQGKSCRLGRLLWRALGDVLEAHRAVLEPVGEPWGRFGRAGSGPGGVVGGLWKILEAHKGRLGGSQGRLGAVLGALEAMLEPSGRQNAPKMEPKRISNRAMEATRAQNGETLIFLRQYEGFQ